MIKTLKKISVTTPRHTKDVSWNEINYYNQHSYGTSRKLSRKMLISIFTIICIATPGTNWIIPILSKTIKTGVMVRW